MRRPVMIVLSCVLLATIGGFVALAVADARAGDRIADGVRVRSVEVGGLTREQATARLQKRIVAAARRPVTLRVAGRDVRLSARRAGVGINVEDAVDHALDVSREGGLIQRGWRALTGEHIDRDLPAPISVDTASVDDFVDQLAKAVTRKPRDASLHVTTTSVTVDGDRAGRTIAGRKRLVRRIVAALRAAQADRHFAVRTRSVQPDVTTDDVWQQHPTAVTVSHEGRMVRVFDHGELVKTYDVAVGDPQYPTPSGQFAVQTMQVNPTWNVPQSAWAGSLAGKTIPGGDPRNPLIARWIGFDGAVGFHGTDDAGSIGQAASHGCVRMRPADVIDLYKHVDIGTLVLVD